MKKIIIVISLVFIAALMYTFISHPKEITKQKSDSISKIMDEDVEILELPKLDDKALVLDEDENLMAEDMDNELMEEERESQEVEPEIVATVHDIMVESDLNEIGKKFAPKEGITPVAGIEISKGTISSLKVGDRVLLPYMGTGEYEAEISAKTTHANGSVSVTGNLLDGTNQYSVVLTEGKNTAFGTVSTPDGSFEIETKDGQGYVYSTDEIDNKWIDYNQSDTLHSDH